MVDFEVDLGHFGQMPSMATYCILTYGFPISSPREDVVKTLTTAANAMCTAFPWLSGQVTHSNSSSTTASPNSGTYSIRPYEAHSGPSKFVSVKDCTSLSPSFSSLLAKGAPPALLQGEILSPAYGFANVYPASVTQPVAFVQANFIDGGLLLTVACHHQVADGNGTEHFTKLFATCCRGEKIPDEDIKWGNADRNTIISPLRANEKPDPLDGVRCASALGNPEPAWPPEPSKGLWKLCRFSAATIQALKKEASRECESGTYISSNDALSAFLWQRIMSARSALGREGSAATKLLRAVNARKRLEPPLPLAINFFVHPKDKSSDTDNLKSSYIGHCIVTTTNKSTFATLTQSSLSQTAVSLREVLRSRNDHYVRSFFHTLKTTPDRSTFAYGAEFNPGDDLMITSFVAQASYTFSFGPQLNEASFVRRPLLPDCPSLFYLMPRMRNGDVEFTACLAEEEWEVLGGDGKWGERVEFVG